MSSNVMLAHCYKPEKHEKKIEGWWMSVKYDGVRAKWNGVGMESRTGKTYTLPDFLTEQLLKITDKEGNPMKLDGELWGGNDTFAFMSGLARRFENNDELWKNVKYMIFDTPDTNIPLFEDRVTKIKKALKRAGPLVNIEDVKHSKFISPMNINEELLKVEKAGGEGIILRKPFSPYVFTRSHDLLKVKSWLYKEAIVTGYVEGIGKYTGMVGSLAVKSDEFGEDEDEEDTDKKWVNFKVGSGLNDFQRYSGDLTSSDNWKSKSSQLKIDDARKLKQENINREDENYKKLLNIIKTTTGKDKIDALHLMNEKFVEMPILGSLVTFRYKELTKDGNPSMPTFVGVRNYE